MGVQNIENGIGENRVTGVEPLKFSINIDIFEIRLQHMSITNFQAKITWQPLEIPR
jgi:hypothetical protein